MPRALWKRENPALVALGTEVPPTTAMRHGCIATPDTGSCRSGFSRDIEAGEHPVAMKYDR
jgi:hypothetical protein